MRHGTNLEEALKQSETVLKHKLDIMKTTENISLAGYAFTIETDAYIELGTYLTDIKEAFKNDANAEEIISDIEERIAELLREKCISGMVVDLKMVQEIKRRIGNPRELVQDDEESSTATSAPHAEETKKDWKSKRLYRNVDEKVLGGVCSGLGTYFGLDKVLFRIAFMVLIVISLFAVDEGPYLLFPILAYICLWIAMPAARTAEQKREMKRKPTNLDNYRSNDFNFGTEVREAVESPAGRAFKRAGGVFLGILLLLTGLGGMIGCVVIPSVPAIISHEIADEIEDWGPLDAEEQLIADLLTNNDTFWIFIIIIVGLMFIWFIYNGIMLLFDLKAPSWKPGLVIFISWVISIFVFAGYVAKIAVDSLGKFLVIL